MIEVGQTKMVARAEEERKKKSQPQLVKLDKALKLAEQWVNNMSKPSSEGNFTPMELEGRPSGLGIGATVPKESKMMLSSNPIERKLFSKLQTDKRKAYKRNENLASSGKDGKVEEDSEDESESKTRAFSKKRPLSFTSSLNAKRKR